MVQPVASRSLSRLSRHLPLLLAGAALVLTAAKAKQCVPTPKELICSADSECGGPPPAGVTCGGAWACVDAGCEWVCDAVEPTCYSSSECGGGQHCSVEDGVCDAPAGCGGSMGCAAVCAGTCVDDQVTTCFTEWDCPSGMMCDTSGGGGGAADVWCPPCDDPALPCECGAPAPPQGVCVPAPVEICDGLDNDFDGLVDEDDVCVSQTCYSDSDCPLGTVCQFGMCPPCVPGQVCPACLVIAWGTCSAPTPEPCDGIDNDYDGLVDEDGCPGTNACTNDVDCALGEMCIATPSCWETCDSAGNCSGGCGTEYVCVPAAP